MKIYLDSCSLQRPLDSKDQVRILLEAESVLAILALVESNAIELISSEPLLYEAIRNPHISRKEYALEILEAGALFIEIDDKIEIRAREFIEISIKPLDSLHLACAEKSKADYFCTCDDTFLKKAKLVTNLITKAVSPIELIGEIEK